MCDLNRKLLKLLQCNICYNYMQEPIHFCSRGHNACHNCVRKYVQCQQCKHPFLTTRNIALETLCYEAKRTCDHCALSFPIHTFVAHQEQCQLYKCHKEVIAADYIKRICRWSGCIEDVFKHYKSDHPNSVFEVAASKRFKWKLPFRQSQFEVSVIRLQDEDFRLLVYYDFKGQCLCFAVATLRYREVDGEQLNYRFGIEINQGVDKRGYEGVIQERICTIEELNQSDKWLKIRLDEFNIDKRNIEWVLTIN